MGFFLRLKDITEHLEEFNCSLFRKHHIFKFSKLDCKFIASSIQSTVRKILVSSAYIKISQSRDNGKSLINKTKISGPKTEPWGTPELVLYENAENPCKTHIVDV